MRAALSASRTAARVCLITNTLDVTAGDPRSHRHLDLAKHHDDKSEIQKK
jgi:hypothetical protein